MATASKAFRARAFDSNRSMTVYWGHELPDLSECSVGNRAVTQMPSGMEKEEEMESHLQHAILAQQASTSGVQVPQNQKHIPTPKVESVDEQRYNSTYHNKNNKQRTKYIKVHAWQALERDEPEYDYDTEDEAWLSDHNHIEPRILEKIFDTVESHSSETQIASEDSVINIHKSLDSSIVYEVYEYWLSKRTSAATTSGCIGVGGLIPRVRTECRKDGQGAVNPYVAFRRRAEKMQTRKNRKNDEDSYEKILKLVHDMSKAQQLFDMTARREKQKLALIDMESEILMKRMEMSDFGTSSVFNEFRERIRAVASEPKPLGEINGPIPEASEVLKKRKKIRRRAPQMDRDLVSKAWLKKNAESWNRPPALFGQNGTVPSSTVTQKPIREAFLDGRYAFKRRRGCVYRAALTVYNTPPPQPVPSTVSHAAPAPTASSSTVSVVVSVSQAPSTWGNAQNNQELVPTHMRFYPTFIKDGAGRERSLGFARRRMGRGGRVLFDRLPRHQEDHRQSTVSDPWAEYCVADNSKTFRARQSSLGTEEETEDMNPKNRYFTRSDRVNFNDDDNEREWSSRYQQSTLNSSSSKWWRETVDAATADNGDDMEMEVPRGYHQQSAKKFNKDLTKTDVTGQNSTGSVKGGDEEDSEVERMEVDGQEDEAQITVPSKVEEAKSERGEGVMMMKLMNGNDPFDEKRVDMDMDVDDMSTTTDTTTGTNTVDTITLRNGSSNGTGHLKPLLTTQDEEEEEEEHSPSGNGIADRAEPTPVPAKMCGTVSDSDDWREPSGSPSESNSSTEWGGYTAQEQQNHLNGTAVSFKEKLMNDVDDDEEQQPRGARDHSIKEFFDVNGNNAGTKKVHDAIDNRDVI